MPKPKREPGVRPKPGQDDDLAAVYDVLAGFKALQDPTRHPSTVVAYRVSPSAINVKVVDPTFRRFSLDWRHDAVWERLCLLPQHVQRQVASGLLVCATSEYEAKTSLAGQAFEAEFSPDPLAAVDALISEITHAGNLTATNKLTPALAKSWVARLRALRLRVACGLPWERRGRDKRWLGPEEGADDPGAV